MPTTTVHVDGIGPVPATITDRGQGHTFLLLHGGAGPLSVTAFADTLAETEQARVIAPTHPGFGGTPRPDALDSPQGLAALYVALADELDLTDGRHLPRTGFTVHRAAFEEDGRDDVVPTADIGEQLGQQVGAALGLVPEVMVGIDDREIWFQRRLGGALGEPGFQFGVVAIAVAAEFAFCVSNLGHFGFLRLCAAGQMNRSVSA